MSSGPTRRTTWGEARRAGRPRGATRSDLAPGRAQKSESSRAGRISSAPSRVGGRGPRPPPHTAPWSAALTGQPAVSCRIWGTPNSGTWSQGPLSQIPSAPGPRAGPSSVPPLPLVPWAAVPAPMAMAPRALCNCTSEYRTQTFTLLRSSHGLRLGKRNRQRGGAGARGLLRSQLLKELSRMPKACAWGKYQAATRSRRLIQYPVGSWAGSQLALRLQEAEPNVAKDST